MQQINAPAEVRKYFWELTGEQPGAIVSRLAPESPPPDIFGGWDWWFTGLNRNRYGPGFPSGAPTQLDLLVDGKSLKNNPLIFQVEHCMVVRDEVKALFEGMNLSELHFQRVSLRFLAKHKLQADGLQQAAYNNQENGYWWMRAGPVLDIIDQEASEAKVLPSDAPLGPFVGPYEKIRLNVERINEPIFRVLGREETFVSDRVARELISLGVNENGIRPFFLNIPAVRDYHAAGGARFYLVSSNPPPSLAT